MKIANSAASKTAASKVERKTELDNILAQIGRASKALNAAASEATKTIETLEERLVAAEPGIAVWGATLVTEKATYQREDGTLDVGQRVVTLGFERVKKEKWGLAVREELRGKNGLALEDISLLRKADRNLRLLAVPHLEALARQILDTLEAQVSHVEALRAAAVPAEAVPEAATAA